MAGKYILAIDQGTTGTTVLIFDHEGKIVGRSYSEFTQHYPKPGWVEHDANEIWQVTRRVASHALADAKADLLLYGNAERAVVEVAQRLAAGEAPRELDDIRGVALFRKVPADYTELHADDLDSADEGATRQKGATVIRLPALATEFFLSISDSKYVFLMLINVLLLILGTFMDLAPMLLICTPILLPVILQFGIDPVHFGIVMLLNLGIGLVTPPVGPTMVVGCAIGRVSMEAITKELWPFYIVMCIVLLLVTYIPEFSLWLPSFLKL